MKISKIALCMVLALTTSLISVAQTTNKKDINFLGIPLSCTINTFTEKVKAKGITISPDNNKVKNGCRLFKGKYYNQEASILATYDITTKKIHSVSATKYSSNLEKLTSLQEELEEMFAEEYSVDTLYTDEVDDRHELTIVEVVNQKDTAEVLLHIQPSYIADYELVVEYQDVYTVNANKPNLNAKHVDFSLLGVRTFDNYEATIKSFKQKGYRLKENSIAEPDIFFDLSIEGVPFKRADIMESYEEVGVFSILSKEYYLKSTAEKAYETLVQKYRNEYKKYEFLTVKEEVCIKNDKELPSDGSSTIVKYISFLDEDGHSFDVVLKYQSRYELMAKYDDKYEENHWYVVLQIMPCKKK